MMDEHLIELVQAFAFGVKVGAVSVGVPVVLVMLVATWMITRLNKGPGKRGGVR